MDKKLPSEREVIINIIESKLCIHILAEYFARKFKEKKIKDKA